VPSESVHAAFWHTLCNDAQAIFSIQTTREQGISYKGQSTDDGYGYRMPVYWVFQLLSQHHGEEVVASALRGGNTIAAPTDGLYTDPEYSFQRVTRCASVSGDALYLALLNKDAHETVEVTITIGDWQVKPSAQVYTVGAESYLAENTIERPQTVTLSGPQTWRPAQPGAMIYPLKPNTLAVLRFQHSSGAAAAGGG